MRLRQTIATPAGKAPFVRSLFATIADRYDVITVLLSYGQDRHWKRRVIDLAGPLNGRRALDLACGTGDLAFAAAARGARVTGLDLTPRMIALAKAKVGGRMAAAPMSPWTPGPMASHEPTASHEPMDSDGPIPRFLVGDMMALPFAGASFDVVTTGYGLRNVPALGSAIAEIHRVLAPGGLFLSLDFNRPSRVWLRRAYLAYLTVVGSALGFVLHGDPDTYRYIAESIRQYPGADAVTGQLVSAGFTDARWVPVLGGLMAIHVAHRAAAA